MNTSLNRYQKTANAPYLTFADQGEHALKGVADPVRVFEVRGQS